MKTIHLRQLWFISIALLALCALTPLSLQASTVYDDAVSYWQFSANTNPTADSNGSNSGAVNGASWTNSGRIGGAYAFDGVGEDDDINFGNGASLNLPGNFSLSAWFNPLEAAHIEDPGHWPGILGKSPAGAIWGEGWGLYLDDGSDPTIGGTAFDIGYEEGRGTEETYHDLYAGPYALNNWNQVVIVGEGTMRYAYINGVLVSSEDFESSRPIVAADLYLSHEPDFWWTDSEFNGTLDQIAIWDKALTASDVATMFETDSLTAAMATGGAFGFDYSSVGIDSVLSVYTSHTSLEVDGITWKYFSSNPAWVPSNLVAGASYDDGNGNYYVMLEAGGVGNGPLPPPGETPEPATIVGLGLVVLAVLNKTKGARHE